MEHWPLPPFFRDARTGAEPGQAEALYLDEAGAAIKGRLTWYAPARGGFGFMPNGQSGEALVPFAAIQSLHLIAPIQLVPDTELIDLYRRSGGAATEPAARAFVLRLSDGQPLQGETRGFVRTHDGLYLYMVTHDDLSVRMFIPHGRFSGLQIGALLGEHLVASGLTDRGQIQAALGEQAERRLAIVDAHYQDPRIDDPATLAAVVEERAIAPSQIRVGDILFNQGLVSRDQLFEALARMHRDKRALLGQILIEMGVLTAARLAQAVSDQLGVPMVSLGKFDIQPAVAALVDPEFAIGHQVLPLLATERSLVVAVENPVEAYYLDELRFSTQRQVMPVIADADELAQRIQAQYASRSVADKSATIRKEIDELGSRLAREAASTSGPAQNRQVTESDTLLVRLVNNMIVYAHEQGASDIHVEAYPDDAPTRIRFRIDGVLSDYLQLPSALRSALISRLKIMADLDISEHRRPQDGKIDFHRFAPLKLELRVASLPTANGLEDVVMRLLSSTRPIPLGELGIGAELTAQLRAMVQRSYGLILVCGPTGSGKTTTLHSLLAEVNTPENKIWTAEDPIEITHPGLRQIQMIPRAGLTFATAMRAFLRADPDIIMVGEMRDVETARIAIEASLTGHLVLSTLHTNSAPESIVRLLDLGLDPFNFSDALVGVLGQRLARRLCADCKTEVDDADEQLRQLALEYCQESVLDPDAILASWQAEFSGGAGGPRLYRSVGCDKCHKSGYHGRIGIYELMAATPQIKRLIQARKPAEALFVQAVADGMLRLKQYGIRMVLHGHTDIRSVRSACA